MPGFKRFGGNREGGKKYEKRSFGKKKFGDRDSGRASMHKATCSECGSLCEVPFKPFADKPVFCNSCFRKDKDAGPGKPERNYKDRGFDRDFGHKSGGQPVDKYKEQFETINAKLDRILKTLKDLQEDDLP